MTWFGAPRWTGGIVNDIELIGAFVPIVNGELIFVQIDGCNDYFLMIFPTVEKLHKVFPEFMGNVNITVPYTVHTIDNDSLDGLEQLRERGIRLMYDPEIVNRNHTKWKEVIHDGEQWKFSASRN